MVSAPRRRVLDRQHPDVPPRGFGAAAGQADGHELAVPVEVFLSKGGCLKVVGVDSFSSLCNHPSFQTVKVWSRVGVVDSN